jgi:Phosphotransferase enzyme family
MTEDEHILTGGNVAARVVRVGETVRKPVTIATPSVKSLLNFLQDRGYPACPQHFGIDEQGRQSLEFVPGVMANARTPLSLADLEQVGRLIRQLHELTACFPIPADARWDVPIRPDHDDLICHNDLAPWNLVRNGDRWVFIDWDNSGPGSRLWDLSYAAITFPPIEPQGDITEIGPRVRALIRGYGLSPSQGDALPALMRRRAQAMGDLLVNGAEKSLQPWAQMYEADHARYWLGAAQFVEEHSLTLQDVCRNP